MRHSLAAALLLASGCGEPPVDGDFLGEPVFELPMRVGIGPFGSPSMRITVLWSADPAETDRNAWVEHRPWFDPLPARDGTLRFFDPPPLAGVGRIVAYDGADGRWVPETPLFGFGTAVIVYTAETGYFAVDNDDVCCADDLAGCASMCRDDSCGAERIVLGLMPDPSVEIECDD